jgi:hypothetical protein
MLLPFGDDGEGTPRNKGGICELPDTRALQGRRTIRRIVNDVASCDASRSVPWSLPCAKRTRNAALPLFVTQA